MAKLIKTMMVMVMVTVMAITATNASTRERQTVDMNASTHMTLYASELIPTQDCRSTTMWYLCKMLQNHTELLEQERTKCP